MTLKNCIICGKQFDAKHNWKTCSEECKKERRRKYQYNFIRENKEYYAEQTSNWQKRNPEKVRMKARRRYERDKEKLKLRVSSQHYAKKLGLPKEGICPDCKKQRKLEIHHITYTLDDFILMCKKCHLKRHSRTLWRGDV